VLNQTWAPICCSTSFASLKSTKRSKHAASALINLARGLVWDGLWINKSVVIETLIGCPTRRFVVATLEEVVVQVEVVAQRITHALEENLRHMSNDGSWLVISVLWGSQW
jgi:hypothetical protein